MNQKELTKTFMKILNWKNPFDCDVFLQINSALQGLMLYKCFVFAGIDLLFYYYLLSFIYTNIYNNRTNMQL